MSLRPETRADAAPGARHRGRGSGRRRISPRALQRTPPTQILHEIEVDVPARVAQEGAQLAVCHGDLCLPNVVVDPDSSQVRGLIDLGRLGKADPYVDIALLLATARETWSDEAMARHADQEFAEIYGTELDPER